AVGLYGVLAFSVAQRSFEMGVRIALGARPGDVLALVTRQGMVLVAGGLVIGLVLSVAASRAIASLLYHVTPTDPLAHPTGATLHDATTIITLARSRMTAIAADSGKPIAHRQVLVVFSGLVLAMLLAALDSTIVSTALPTIVGELGGLAHLSWVVTAYLLAQ